MNLDKTLVKEPPAAQQKPWQDRGEGMRQEDSQRRRRQDEEMQMLNQNLESLNHPSE